MSVQATFSPKNQEKSSDVGAGLSLLEQLAERSVARCRNPKAPILFGYHKNEGRAVIHKADCKMWQCTGCGARKAKRAIALCINHINTVGGQWYFMTITAHEKWRGSEASYENLSRNWHKLRKRMRDQHGGHFDYFRTWEMHEDGSWHMHLLTNAVLPYKEKVNKKGEKNFVSSWLKKNARESGLGYMTDYQPLDNAGFAAHYVAKYMTKSTEDDDKWIKGMRRYQTSQGWTKLNDLSQATDYDWKYIESGGNLWFEYHNAKDAGFEVYLTSHGQKVTSKKAMDFFYGVRKMTPPLVQARIWGTRSDHAPPSQIAYKRKDTKGNEVKL